MSLYGIRNLPTANVGVDRAREQQRARVEQHAPQPAAPASKPGAAQALAPAASSLPAQAPPGTDPELWSVLTGEERAFFAKVGAMGPLTYGRMLGAQPAANAPMARGGRLDVKV